MTANRAPQAGTEALYLFCFALAERVLRVPSPLHLVRLGPVGAVVRGVPLEEFTGEAAEDRMQDPEWVGPRVLEHERVVEETMEFSPVFPARFGTLFSTRESLSDLMDRHRETISSFLGRMEGRAEWAVKGYVDRKSAGAALAARREADGEKAAGSAGRRYLEQRRRQEAAMKDVGSWAEAKAREIRGELLATALEAKDRPLLAHAPEPGRDMVFNWAFLVDDSRAPEFVGRLEHLDRKHRSEGLVLRASGPLPPYTFVPSLDPIEGRA